MEHHWGWKSAEQCLDKSTIRDLLQMEIPKAKDISSVRDDKASLTKEGADAWKGSARRASVHGSRTNAKQAATKGGRLRSNFFMPAVQEDNLNEKHEFKRNSVDLDFTDSVPYQTR